MKVAFSVEHRVKPVSCNPGCNSLPMPYVWSVYDFIEHIFVVPSTNQLSPEKHENLIFSELLDI